MPGLLSWLSDDKTEWNMVWGVSVRWILDFELGSMALQMVVSYSDGGFVDQQKTLPKCC